MITSLNDFIEFCKTATHNEIYEMFEYTITDELRDRIYSFAAPSSAEPFREALSQLGIDNY